MPKTDRSVVRNKPYTKKAISIRERHNERKNESYSNPDVMPEQSVNNIYFKKCEGTYAQMFDKLVQDGVVSTRGLKPDANVFDEMVFDVNTAYFDRNGAVKIAGSEQYIISAVMHADERNRSLSAARGYDVYHYHMHVVYVPVVEKEIKWTKRCKDQALVGKVKEVIRQVSHSKKWSSRKMTDEHGNILRDGNGKTRLLNSYSLLQDRFYEHMHKAGYVDFERGIRGSTTEHLSVLDYKIQKDTEKIAEIKRKAQAQKQEMAEISKELKPKREVYKTFLELEQTGKRKKLSGKVELTGQEFDDMVTLAKEGVVSRSTISNLKQKLEHVEGELSCLKVRFDEFLAQTRDFFAAIKLAPHRVKEVFTEIFEKARQERELRRASRSRNHSRDDDLVR